MTNADTELIASLKTARGARWGELFKQADATVGEELRDQFRALKTANGCVTVMDIAKMAVRFNLPLRTTFHFLEDGQEAVLPSGAGEMFIARCRSVSEVLGQARRALGLEVEESKPCYSTQER